MTADDVATAVQLACLLEAGAPKPGNVSPGRPFHDTSYEDFVASAAAIGPAFRAAGSQPLGATILAAVEATRRWTSANTNLGIILLCAPLARAAAGGPARSLRARVRDVLATTTVEDARQVYAAIRLAAPGGLGTSPDQDVQAEPTIPLADTMALAAHRDAVASEYATAFARTFTTGAPSVAAALDAGLGWSDAAVEAYLALLAEHPDTLIARKLGGDAAEEVRGGAARALLEGGIRSDAGRAAVARLDASLRDPRNRRNPGATADLTAAALLVVILERRWPDACGAVASANEGR
jgi:triphosphoribosyl-dephospho-CoA synthase